MTDPIATAQSALSAAVDNRAALRNALLDQDGAIDAALAALATYTPPDLPFRVVAADPSGATVANAAFQSAFDAGGIVWVGAGRYLIDTEIMLALRSGLILLMHPNAQLMGKPNAVKRSYVLSGRNISDFIVAGGRLIGDRLAHTYVAGSTNEWCMGIGLTGCKRGLVRDLYASQFAGDGLSITGEDLSIVNVTSTHNRRQGLSVYSGRGIRIIGGEYSYTGALGSNPGTPPMAGIDLEPDTGLLEDVLIAGVRSIGNGTTDLLAYCNAQVQGIRNVRIEDCTVVGAPNGVEGQSAGAGRIEITALRNKLGGHTGSAFKVGAGVTLNAGDATLANANTITSNAPRAPVPAFDLQGRDTRTRYDYQVATTGVANVGWNHYASPTAA